MTKLIKTGIKVRKHHGRMEIIVIMQAQTPHGDNVAIYLNWSVKMKIKVIMSFHLFFPTPFFFNT